MNELHNVLQTITTDAQRALKLLAGFLIFCLVLAVAIPAQAQMVANPQWSAERTCIPALSYATATTSSPMTITATKAGVCVRWECARGGKVYVNKLCGLPSELAKVGGRTETIMKAADPLKSLQDAPKRFPILPLSDPMFDAVRVQVP